MLLINCPWCGERDETEFSYGGEAGIVRPKNPEILSDEEWADYLFMRKNTKGIFTEQWNHSSGCRQWFLVKRDTVTYKILDSYKFDHSDKETKGSK
tara:strand:- start:1365 stop:1652 length:288 start_codon:yes stop_codon:yes gene_type:complete